MTKGKTTVKRPSFTRRDVLFPGKQKGLPLSNAPSSRSVSHLLGLADTVAR